MSEMEVITIETKAYSELLQKLDQLFSRLKNIGNPDEALMDNTDFIKLMKISKRTAQAWRDEGIIAFSQIQGKIYYRQSDINRMLDNFKRPAFKNIKRNV